MSYSHRHVPFRCPIVGSPAPFAATTTSGTGVQGPQGVQGAPGPQGVQGDGGVGGGTGVQGALGAQGVQGTSTARLSLVQYGASLDQGPGTTINPSTIETYYIYPWTGASTIVSPITPTANADPFDQYPLYLRANTTLTDFRLIGTNVTGTTGNGSDFVVTATIYVNGAAITLAPPALTRSFRGDGVESSGTLVSAVNTTSPYTLAVDSLVTVAVGFSQEVTVASGLISVLYDVYRLAA